MIVTRGSSWPQVSGLVGDVRLVPKQRLVRTGLVITVVVILAIFCISTITGRYLFYMLLTAFVILLLCLVAIYWVYQQKQQLRASQISHPLSKEDLYVYGIRFNPLDVGLSPGRVTIY